MEPYHLRRHDKAIESADDFARILVSIRTISLAMCSDNEPYLITLNHGWDSELQCLWFHSAPTGKKIDILRENSRVWGMAVEDLGYLERKDLLEGHGVAEGTMQFADELLFEPIIRFQIRNGLPDRLEPAGPNPHGGIELRNIRLDVQKRGSIKDVHVLDLQHTLFDRI